MDARGRVRREVRKAIEDGVRLDVGHGRGSFSWDVMSAAMKEDVLPGTISSDLHQFNVTGPVFDLATTLSKFLHLGMPLEKVIECATINPAHTFRFPNQPGTLRVGSEADVAVFRILEGDFEMLASSLDGSAREAHRASQDPSGGHGQERAPLRHRIDSSGPRLTSAQPRREFSSNVTCRPDPRYTDSRCIRRLFRSW